MQEKNSFIATDISSRLKLFRERTKLNGASFARQAGLHPNSYPKYEKGTGFTLITASKLATGFPDLNLRWLLTGEGRMSVQPKENMSVAASDDQVGLLERLIESKDETIIAKDRMIGRLEAEIADLKKEMANV